MPYTITWLLFVGVARCQSVQPSTASGGDINAKDHHVTEDHQLVPADSYGVKESTSRLVVRASSGKSLYDLLMTNLGIEPCKM